MSSGNGSPSAPRSEKDQSRSEKHLENAPSRHDQLDDQSRSENNHSPGSGNDQSRSEEDLENAPSRHDQLDDQSRSENDHSEKDLESAPSRHDQLDEQQRDDEAAWARLTESPTISPGGLNTQVTSGSQRPDYFAEAGGQPLTARTTIHGGTPPDENRAQDPNLILWDGPHDPGNPRNIAVWRKWVITLMLGIMTFAVTFGSSVFSSATRASAKRFGVSQEVMTLGTCLYVLGYAFGPIAFGPLSELYGRKNPLFFGMLCFAIFQIPVAVARNVQTVMLCRFFGGFFGSAPLAIVGGELADIFAPVERGIAVSIFAANTFIGPVAGPIVGGFITMSYLTWRWTEYITCIMAFFFGTLAFFIVPETFEPVLLQRRAKKIRYRTRNWAIHAPADEVTVSLRLIAEKYILRPFTMLALEPILILVTLYMGFTYAFLYLCFEAYPVAFGEVRGWNLGVSALPFIAILVGVMIGVIIVIIFSKTRFESALKKQGHIVPEERLIPMIIGGILLPGGMFWFGWTSHPHVLWVPQAIAGGAIGGGILLIFLQGMNYIIDVYALNANSAIAANTFFRSCLAGGFAMFATAMFKNMGVDWAMTLLGCMTVVMLPVPITFYFFGAKIRSWSKFSPSN